MPPLPLLRLFFFYAAITPLRQMLPLLICLHAAIFQPIDYCRAGNADNAAADAADVGYKCGQQRHQIANVANRVG